MLHHLQNVLKRKIEGILFDRIQVTEIRLLELRIGPVCYCHRQAFLP